MSRWITSRFEIDLTHPRVMGVVNVTPDSFSDGGRYDSAQAAIAHCEQLVREGAELLDIGGESSRPGAEPVPLEQERDRVLPVLREALKLGVPVSVDTYKPDLMREALDLGADIINDITALRVPGALEAVSSHPRCGVCLMHMLGEPKTMQQQPVYRDVVQEVAGFLRGRAQVLQSGGVAPERIVLDPGYGFGKTMEDNFELQRRQRELLALGYPLLVGWSRKSSLGTLIGRGVDDRLVASVAAALGAISHGARVVRVHDVAATVDALRVWQAMALA